MSAKTVEEILNDLAYGRTAPDSKGNPIQEQVSVSEAKAALKDLIVKHYEAADHWHCRVCLEKTVQVIEELFK